MKNPIRFRYDPGCRKINEMLARSHPPTVVGMKTFIETQTVTFSDQVDKMPCENTFGG